MSSKTFQLLTLTATLWLVSTSGNARMYGGCTEMQHFKHIVNGVAHKMFRC